MSNDHPAKSQWTLQCKRLAAIDLALRGAKFLAETGDVLSFKVITSCVAAIFEQDDAEVDYCNGLEWCNVVAKDIDAAIKAILVTNGELPLPLITTPLDRGRLGNMAASAGAVVVDCGKALARAHGNPKATFVQVNRATVDLERARAAHVTAEAALDAIGRYGSEGNQHSSQKVSW